MYELAYSTYIESMNDMDQWPKTTYQKPLTPIKRRMPGRPPHKRKMDPSEGDGARSRLSRKGQVVHCQICNQAGHNKRGCPKKPSEEETQTSVSVGSRGRGVRTRGGSARGIGGVKIRGGSVSGGVSSRGVC